MFYGPLKKGGRGEVQACSVFDQPLEKTVRDTNEIFCEKFSLGSEAKIAASLNQLLFP